MSLAYAQIEQIALYLGRPWKINRLRESSSWSYEIIDGFGRGLHFRVDGQKFIVSGQFSRARTIPCGDAYKSIGVSIERPAKAIAADIMRRLVPHYLASYETAVQRYTEEQERQERLSLIAGLLARVTGGRVCDHSRAARSVYFKNAAAEIWKDETITLTLRNVSVEQAIRIAALLEPEGGA